MFFPHNCLESNPFIDPGHEKNVIDYIYNILYCWD